MIKKTKQTVKRVGRPTLPAGKGRDTKADVRITKALKKNLASAAKRNGRKLSEEILARLDLGSNETAALLSDLACVIRWRMDGSAFTGMAYDGNNKRANAKMTSELTEQEKSSRLSAAIKMIVDTHFLKLSPADLLSAPDSPGNRLETRMIAYQAMIANRRMRR